MGCAGGVLRYFAETPFADETTFDFNSHVARLRDTTRELDVEPNLQRFFARGGRFILWHGWADAAISPQATIDFYEAAIRRSGPQASDSMRLFMAPGAQHCMGGAGAANLGQHGPPMANETPERNVMSAMQAWVEHGRAPDMLIARQGGLMDVLGAGRARNAQQPTAPSPPREYLLCAYPNEARLRSGGDSGNVTDYVCRPPAGSGR
jgi:feruloyl esterase